jgi:hypothetical protein
VNARSGRWAAIALITVAAPASAADLLGRCVGIDAPEARLACYDAAAGRPVQRTTPTPGVAAPTATATPAAVMAARSEVPRDFGLSPAQRKVEPSGPESIRGRIVGISTDRAGHAALVLDSGQVWSVVDADARLDVGQDVTIGRGALGSFLLTTPDRHAYHVHRTR